MMDIAGLITLVLVIVIGVVLKNFTHRILNTMDGVGSVRARGVRNPHHNIGDL